MVLTREVGNTESDRQRHTRTFYFEDSKWATFGRGLVNTDQSKVIATAVVSALGDFDGLDVVHLWPFPDKIAMFLILFVILEYIVDYLPWHAIKGGVQPDITNLNNLEVYEANTNQPPTAEEDSPCAGSVSVLTLNVWVNKVQENIEKQIRGIRNLQPDVVCLQEVFHLDVLEAYRKAFPDYRFIAFGRGHTVTAFVALMFIMITLATTFSALVALAERITNGKWRITWLIVGPVVLLLYLRIVRHHWTVAFLTGNRTGLAMLVRKDAVELDDKKVVCIPFTRRALAADQLNLLRPRGFISAPGSIRLRNGHELQVRFCTTHLNQPLEQSIGDGRHRQVREVLDHCVKEDEFLVVGCDLNATPPGTKNGSDCQSYSDMCKELGDAWVDVNPSDPKRDGLTWDQQENPMCTSMLNNLFYGSESLRWRCDYIFWRYMGRKGLQSPEEQHSIPSDDIVKKRVPAAQSFQVAVRSCQMVFTGKEAVSDHFGVFSVFDIAEAKDTNA